MKRNFRKAVTWLLTAALLITALPGLAGTSAAAEEPAHTVEDMAELLGSGGEGGAESKSSSTITLYVENTGNWGTVYAYAWKDGTQYTGGWPGTQMTNEGNGIWSITVSAEAVNVIFNDGSGTQTADLTIPTDGSNLYDNTTGTWSVYSGGSGSGGNEGGESGSVPAPDEEITLYVKNTAGWSVVHAYTWSAEEYAITGAWPGDQMTAMGDGIWSISVPARAKNVIFNNGSAGSGNQTSDLMIPTDGSNLYDNSTGAWSVYSGGSGGGDEGESPATYTVTVTADPAEGGTVTGGGTFAENSSVTVSAEAAEGYAFVSWVKNGTFVGSNEAYTFTVTEDVTMTALFESSGEDPNPGSSSGSGDENAAAIFRGTRTDLRDESVYTLIITRFYDGDTGNNVHCWDDGQAGNPDSDPAWRGDFKGLVERLDYIKALGFTAIRLNSVAQNASGYDYHGFHPINLKEIDFRYESDGYTYEDLIDACHARGLKVIQGVVLNNTSNFGEENLRKLFELNEDAGWSITESLIPTETLLAQCPNYADMTPSEQYMARLDLLKESLNADGRYHQTVDGYYWDTYLGQQAQIAGDCVDLNTENPEVALYLAESCAWYAQMGVDAILIDAAKHINRWTFNEGILPLLNNLLNQAGLELDIFCELDSRVRDTWNHNNPSSSVPFYTWAETETEWQNNWNDDHPTDNIQTSIDHYNAHDTLDEFVVPTSDNAQLNGITYHTPDYSQSNGMHPFDFTMMWNFENAYNAFRAGLAEDPYFNDSTWNLMSVDNWDYGPDGMEKYRYSAGPQAWKENLNLMFTFRGIPSIQYGTEVEFQKGKVIDVGPNAPLSETGRAYYGDYLKGTVTATDFGTYEATGKVADTLNSELSQHLRMLNELRRAIPALRKGQYTTNSKYINGNMAFIRRYTNADEGIDSLALVTITDGATFKNIPNGKYVDAVSGDVRMVTSGTLTVQTSGRGGLAVYVCCADGFTGLDAAPSAASRTLRFNPNGGTGTIDSISIKGNEKATLPDCTFTAPACSEFLGWNVNGTLYQPGDEVEFPVDSMARAMWEEVHTAPNHSVAWASDFSSAVAIIECSGCGSREVLDCEITSQWNKDETSGGIALSVTASVSGEPAVADTKRILTLTRSGDTLTITNAMVQAADPVGMVIMVAGYQAGGQMTGCQIMEDVTGVTSETLTVTGDTIKVFFLNSETYQPLFVWAEL